MLNIEAFKKKMPDWIIPTDLDNWLNDVNHCSELFSKLGFSLLSAKEGQLIQNPEQLSFEDDATYFATKEVLSKILFVAKNAEGKYLGYSFCDHPLMEETPIVTYRTSFYLEAGSLVEALLFSLSETKEAYKEYKTAFEKAGFSLEGFEYLEKESDDIYDQYTDPDNLVDTLKRGRDLSHLAFDISKEAFLEWQTPRFGLNNPTVVDSKAWTSFIYSKTHAYAIGQKYERTTRSPIWCFERFGQTLTRVEGKEIFIAGEHEDFYDPDFYIYNDVVVIKEDDSVEIYNYPKDIFPPTDFHSATLIDPNTILIIGSLGYMDTRMPSVTPVYALDINSFEIKKVTTYGENPGWIYRHQAILNKENSSIEIIGGEIQSEVTLENIDAWELDFNTFQWTRLTDKKWKRWRFQKEDETFNDLWGIRQALFSLEMNYESDKDELKELEEKLGYPIDVRAIKKLYQFEDIPSYQEEPEQDEYNLFRIQIQGVGIKFKETSYDIQVTVEGDLEAVLIEKIQNDFLQKIAALENSAYKIERYY